MASNKTLFYYLRGSSLIIGLLWKMSDLLAVGVKK